MKTIVYQEQENDLVIRFAEEQDATDIAELEQYINEAYRVGEKEILKRIEINKQTLVLEVEKKVVGVLFSVITTKSSKVSPSNFRNELLRYETIYQLHEKGFLSQEQKEKEKEKEKDQQVVEATWIHFIVAPDHRQFVNLFHTEAKTYFLETVKCHAIYAFTHCVAYDQDCSQSIEQYVETSTRSDQNLFFHTSRGAIFEKVLHEYNHRDHKNSGCAIQMAYYNVSEKTNNSLTNNNVNSGMPKTIDETTLVGIVANLMDAAVEIDFDCPWFELGFDSAKLMQLHSMIEKEAGNSLDVSFLFGVNTLGKLISFFQPKPVTRDETKNSPEDDHLVPMEQEQVEWNVPFSVFGIGLRIPGPPGSDYDIETCEELWQSMHENFEEAKLPWTRLLKNRDRFDTISFKNVISKEQAKSIPLAQRAALQVSCSALADAPSQLVEQVGSRVGVFVGNWETHSQVGQHNMQQLDFNAQSVNTIAGVSNSIIANRISYLFDFTGPSMVVDTACSSSIVALDCALSAIKDGKCEAALVIGVNIINDATTQLLQHAGFLSKDGQCFSFDSRANGYARSEGCGALFIGKPNDNFPERALIHGIDINQDGRTANLHAPSPESQIELVATACDRAQIEPSSVLFVETHGTGTSLGDPIEAYALQQVYGAHRLHDSKLLLTAAKAQFGHMEGAAGMLGLIRTILCLQQGQLPPNKRLHRTNPKVPFEQYNIEPVGVGASGPHILKSYSPDGLLYGGVSSFGFGGTNSHAILSNAVIPRELEQASAINWSSRCESIPYSPFFGSSSRADSTSGDSTSFTVLEPADVDFLCEHKVGSQPVAPATFQILHGMKELKTNAFENVHFEAILEPEEAFCVRKKKTSDLDDTTNSFCLQTDSGKQISSFHFAQEQDLGNVPTKLLKSQASQCTFPAVQDKAEFYSRLGNGYEGAFQVLQQAWRNEQNTCILARLSVIRSASDFMGQVALLDAITHSCFELLPKNVTRRPVYFDSIGRVAINFEYLDQLRDGGTEAKEEENVFFCLVENRGELIFDATLMDQDQSTVVAKFHSLSLGVFQDPLLKKMVFQDIFPEETETSDDTGMPSFEDVHELHEHVLQTIRHGQINVDVSNSMAHQAYLRSVLAEYPDLKITGLPKRRLKLIGNACTPIQSDRFVSIRQNAAYVISGGTGGVGLSLARSLLQNGASRVILLGRNPESMKAHDIRKDPRVTLKQCDVSNLDHVKRALSSEQEIKGIFHCSGILQDATLENLTKESFVNVSAPKEKGAINLLSVVPISNLDFCVFFSSVTSGFGSAGQANYAAANGALDQLASTLRSDGNYPCLSVRWGPWASVGMASGFADRWTRIGLTPLDPELALECLFSLDRNRIGSNAVITIARVDSTKVEVSFPSLKGYLSALNKSRQELDKKFKSGPDAKSLVLKVADMVGLDISNMELPWREAGLDSLSMVEFRNILQQHVDVKLHDTILFDFACAKDLIDFLSTVHQKSDATVENVVSDKPPPSLISIQDYDSMVPEVVGIGCRFPGNVSSPEDFWSLLCSGKDVISSIPLGRFDTERHDKIYSDFGGFISGVDEFDYQKFSISLQEALQMDPKQRLCLKVASEALNDAKLLGPGKTKNIGVFVGVMTNDWQNVLQSQDSTAYSASGHISCVLANRISYVLGLNGPSMAMDTACSSSLVALNAACNAIKLGQCEAAIVMGVNLMLDPSIYEQECAARMLTSQGFCATFSSDADGYVRGEGCVAMVVRGMPKHESANDLKKDSHGSSWGRILGSAVNQDGKSANLTSPNGRAQQDVLLKALKSANVDPESIDYIETHGTGTPLGDPIEIGAIQKVYCRTKRKRKLCLGAVKTVLGHTEAASGLAGLLKALLALRYGVVPSNLHFAKINPKVADVMSPDMVFPSIKEPYQLDDSSVVGVSSFGFGGTNAHVLIGAPTIPRLYDSKSAVVLDVKDRTRVEWKSPSDLAYCVLWSPLFDKMHNDDDVVSKVTMKGQQIFNVNFVQDVVSILETEAVKSDRQHDLVFITRGAFKEDQPSIQARQIWAFVRSLRLERPSRKFFLLDSDEVVTNSGDLQIAADHLDQRFVKSKDGTSKQILVPAIQKLEFCVEPMALTWPFPMKSTDTILITGGSGGIAKTIASFLLEQSKFCGNIILVSRSGSKPEELSSYNQVHGASCDISNLESVTELANQLGSVSVILHAAGILQEQPSTNYSDEWFENHVRVKLDGAKNLTNCFSESLELFVGFSSTSAVFGMKNGAAYSASNASLDAYISSLAIPAISIQWDIWAQVGMAHERGMYSDSRGLSNRQACHMLIGLLENIDRLDKQEVIIISTDWHQFPKSPILRNVIDQGKRVITNGTFPTESTRTTVEPTKGPIHADSPSDQVIEWIFREAASFLGDTSEINAAVKDDAWNQMGFDSLSMTEFIASCNKKLQFVHDSIHDTAMFDYPTPEKFATFLLSILETDSATQAISESASDGKSLNSRSSGMAIVSVALRFPGSIENNCGAGFWDFLINEGDAIGCIPKLRLGHDRPGASKTRDLVYVDKGAFIDPQLFDHVVVNESFKKEKYPISSSELAAMDPQQKIALKVATEALEQARSLGVKGDEIGVFVGAQNPEFATLQHGKVNTFTATGTSLSIIANRISYCLGLTGPSMTIDTACSSSLVALDAATKSVKEGDCNAAIVLGVDIMMSMHRFEITCAAKMLSPNCRCATFSDQADGYARGEGCGAIVITKDDGKIPALSILKGIAVNQDGRSANLTSPMGPAQEACIQKALIKAGITPDDVCYLEAHGTGTALGDPQEIQALANVFKNRKDSLYVGAVKSNVGHLEAAAGMAGIIKATLCLLNKKIPKNLHCESLNPRVAKLQSRCNFIFPQEVVNLDPSKTLYAGVSAFGFGGTNTHAILESVPSSRSVQLESTIAAPMIQDPAFLIQKDEEAPGAWKETIKADALVSIREHRVGAVQVIPATTYIELLEPIIAPDSAYLLQDLSFQSMLFVEPECRELDLHVRAAEGVASIKSLDQKKTYATMTYQVLEEKRESEHFLNDLKTHCNIELPAGNNLYDTLGNQYGGPFRGLVEAWTNDTETILIGKIRVDPGVVQKAKPSIWLDAASHVGIAMLPASLRGKPIFAKEAKAYYSAPGLDKMSGHQYVWSILNRRGNQTFDMDIVDSKGSLLAQVIEFTFGFFKSTTPATKARQILYTDAWEENKVTAAKSSNSPITEVIDCETVEELHESLTRLESNPQSLLLVIARCPEQLGYLRVFRKEFLSIASKLRCVWSYPEFGLMDEEGARKALFQCKNEPEIKVESGKFYARRLVKLNTRDQKLEEPKHLVTVKTENAAYVITGGAGALGLSIAKELVARGAKCVILLGRSFPADPLPEFCTFFRCDVTSKLQVAHCIQNIGLDIKGVFHCAGILLDSTIPTMPIDSFKKVADPKVQGARYLYEAVEGPVLDFFIVFSSIAGSIGSIGQANYAAANAGLDQFALESAKVTSVRWGPWATAGMAASKRNLNRWKRLGFPPLDHVDALEELFSLQIDVPSVVTICDFDLDVHRDSPDSYLRLFRSESENRQNIKTLSGKKHESRDSFTEESLSSIVKRIAAQVNPVGEVESLETPWRDAGMDSLAMVEFRNVLQEELDLKLSETVLFDYPTPANLVKWLGSQHKGKYSSLNGEEVSSKVHGNDDDCSAEEDNSHDPQSSPPEATALRANLPPTASPASLANSSTQSSLPMKSNRLASYEPVLVTGVACRLPGGVNSPDSFWSLLSSGTDTLTKVPKSRFDLSSILDEKQTGEPGTVYTDQGAFLDGIEYFDFKRFGISEQEARLMDPQQRIAIEVAHEALLSSSIDRSSKRIGVFVGAMTRDWVSIQQKETATAYSATGHASSIIANRISYVFGLKGPSMTIDTACSSSLVALDMASSAIARGDCDAAIVIGVNLILTPELYVQECAARMLSPSGKCHTFSANANGYARGEGCVGMIIEPDVEEEERGAYACFGRIIGSAVNQDGRSANLTSPNGSSQQEVIRRALKRAKLTPDQISYVETHGTGTTIGDCLEVGALSGVFGDDRRKPLCLGAVKTVVGHGEGAAGLTGLLKVLLCLQHGFVPGNYSLESKKDLSDKVVAAASRSMVFPTRNDKHALPCSECYAGISSFGFGGTNAHIIVGLPFASSSSSSSSSSRSVNNTMEQKTPTLIEWDHTKRLGWTKSNHFFELQDSLDKDEPPLKLKLFGMEGYLPGFMFLDLALWKSENSLEQIHLADCFTWFHSDENVLDIDEEDESISVLEGSSKKVLVSANKTISCDEELQVVDLDQKFADKDLKSWLFDGLAQAGLQFDTQLAFIKSLRVSTNGRKAVIHFQEHEQQSDMCFHPSVLLASFCVLILLGNHDSVRTLDTVKSIEKVIVARAWKSIRTGDLLDLKAIISTDGSITIINEHEKMCSVSFIGISLEENSRYGSSTQLERLMVPSSRLETCRNWSTKPLKSDVKAIIASLEETNKFQLERDYLLEQYCGHQIAVAVSQLPLSFKPVSRHHASIVERWRSMYTLEKYPLPLDRLAPSADVEGQVEFEFFSLVAPHLTSIVKGETDALDVLFTDPKLTTKLYSESGPSMPCNQAIAKSVLGGSLEHARVTDDDRVIRILELGAGTGGTTLHVLPLLKENNVNFEYVFTDISDYFLRAAAKTFKDYETRMHFALLDIEKEHESQGFGPNQFDFIIASNIVHATANLNNSLGNIESLLAPGGVLLLNEATISTAFLDGTFALTSGWWRFLESDPARMHNTDGPLLDRHSWYKILKEVGFEETGLLFEACQGQAVIGARVSRGKANAHFAAATESTIKNETELPNMKICRLDRSSSIEVVAPMVFSECSSGSEDLILVTCLDENPAHGLAWGLAAAARKEQSRKIVCVDMNSSIDDAIVEELLLEEARQLSPCSSSASSSSFLQPEHSFQVSFDENGDRFEARLSNRINVVTRGPERNVSLRRDSIHLITGGLGGLGLVTALAMLQLGARNIVLVSRSGSLRKGLESQDLEEAIYEKIVNWPGANVYSWPCDVSDPVQISQLFDRIDGLGLKLSGIVHSAGIIRNSLLTEMQFESQFKPVVWTKAKAALEIDRIVQERYTLDYFVLYSSAASMFGSVGQGNHSAANGVLDALATFRRSKGLCATSINWGGWADIGFAADSSLAIKNIASQGMGLIPIEHGLVFIRQALLHDGFKEGNFGVSPIEWSTFLRHQTDHRYLAQFGVHVGSDSPSPRSTSEAKDDGVDVITLQHSGKNNYTQHAVKKNVEKLLSVCGIQSMSESFEEQGLDSLSSIELIGLFRKAFDVQLTPTFYLDYPSGNDLVRHISKQVLVPDDEGKESLERETSQESQVQNLGWIEPPFKPALRLFCLPFAGGHPNVYEAWLPLLPANVQLCPLSMPGFGLQTNRPYWESIPKLAESIVDSLPLDIPYALVGSCLGAIISFEVTRRISRVGKRLPEHLFTIAVSAPQDYGAAMKLLYSDRLRENPFFVPSDEQQAKKKFSDLTEKERHETVEDLHSLGFFKDEERMKSLVSNQEYFSSIMGQLAGQMQMAERYEFVEDQELKMPPVTSISGNIDSTIPDGWPARWSKVANGSPHSHFEVQGGGHYIIQTDPEEVVDIVLSQLSKF